MATAIEPTVQPTGAHSHVLVTWGAERDDVARRVEQLGVVDGGLIVELLSPDAGGLRIRVSDDDPDRLTWAVGVIRAGLGDVVLGAEGTRLEEVVVDLLRRQGLHLATAESLAGVGLSTRLSEPTGAAAVFDGGVVAGSVEARRRLLDVDGPEGTVAAAMAMAEGVARALGTDVALALTGLADPARADEDAAATVHIGSWMDGDPAGESFDLAGGGHDIHGAAASHALDHLRHRLLARERRFAARR